MGPLCPEPHGLDRAFGPLADAENLQFICRTGQKRRVPRLSADDGRIFGTGSELPAAWRKGGSD